MAKKKDYENKKNYANKNYANTANTSYYFYIIAMVAIVAVVGIVVSLSGGRTGSAFSSQATPSAVSETDQSANLAGDAVNIGRIFNPGPAQIYRTNVLINEINGDGNSANGYNPLAFGQLIYSFSSSSANKYVVEQVFDKCVYSGTQYPVAMEEYYVEFQDQPSPSGSLITGTIYYKTGTCTYGYDIIYPQENTEPQYLQCRCKNQGTSAD